MFGILLALMFSMPLYQIPEGPNDIAQWQFEESSITINDSLERWNFFEDSSDTRLEQKKKAFILDMDFCTDVDDACALRIAENLHIQGEINLQAISLCTNGPDDINIKAVDGMLDYQKLNIPIGSSSVYIEDTSPYWDILAGYSDGIYDTYDAVKLWRKIISENEFTTICTTGYLTNLKAFCESSPDEYSNLTGMELLNKTKIYIVGGSYPSGTDNNFSYQSDAIMAADWVFNNVKEPLVFITNNIGAPIKCGGLIQAEIPDDPLSKALKAFGTDDGRAAWDPMGVFIAAFGESSEGFVIQKTNINFNNGQNNFADTENGIFLRVKKTNSDEWYQNKLNSLTIP